MYLKEIELKNVGPIDWLKRSLPFHENGNPKPVILIGQNGSGKSIFLSYIVNALLSAKGLVYEDAEVEKDKVFKYRSPTYIRSGKSYSYAKIMFESGLYWLEWQLDRKRSDFESFYKEKPSKEGWSAIQAEESSHFTSNFPNSKQQLRHLLETNCVLYFPPNRFEEPGWLNYDNLINKADYRFLKKVTSVSNRLIVNYAPLKDNQNWLMDVLFDKFTLEMKTVKLPLKIDGDQSKNDPALNILVGDPGEGDLIHNEVNKFLGSLFQTSNALRFGVGKRRARMISIMKDEEQWIPNIFNLSTGETILLNIFLTILKDYDLSAAPFQSLSEIRGIVIIDEVDIHLHSELQYSVLPRLMKLFPKVQFILTSHSPLFLLGLRREFGSGNIEIVNLPEGMQIDVENFEEFEKAYGYYKESMKFKEEIAAEIKKSHKDILFVEGDYDIRYLKKAACLLGKEELLDNYLIVDAGGYGGIKKVYQHFDSKLAEITPPKILLLCDCETRKPSEDKGRLYRRTIPENSINPISSGIENLFPKSTLEKAIAANKAFIDITPEIKKITRGKEEIIGEKWEVNKDEKGNLCDWIIAYGQEGDFVNFVTIFDILSEIKKLG